MASDLIPRLRVPTFLAVSTFGLAAGCGDDGGSDTSDDGASTMSATSNVDGSGTASPATSGESGTSSPTTATGDSSGTSTTGGDTGSAVDCAMITDAGECDAETACIFFPEFGGCIRDCSMIADETTCLSSPGCEWLGDACDFEPIA